MMAFPINYYLYLSLVLFAIGLSGILFLHCSIRILMCIELMLNSVNLLFVAFSTYNKVLDAQIMVLFIMIIAAAEVAVGLAVLIMTYKIKKSTNIEIWNKLKW